MHFLVIILVTINDHFRVDSIIDLSIKIQFEFKLLNIENVINVINK